MGVDARAPKFFGGNTFSSFGLLCALRALFVNLVNILLVHSQIPFSASHFFTMFLYSNSAPKSPMPLCPRFHIWQAKSTNPRRLPTSNPTSLQLFLRALQEYWHTQVPIFVLAFLHPYPYSLPVLFEVPASHTQTSRLSFSLHCGSSAEAVCKFRLSFLLPGFHLTRRHFHPMSRTPCR